MYISYVEENEYITKYWCDICGKEILENVAHIACETATKVHMGGESYHFHNEPCLLELLKPLLLTRCKNKYGNTVLLIDSDENIKTDVKEYLLKRFKPSVDKNKILNCIKQEILTNILE